jgi:hypothetical protein
MHCHRCCPVSRTLFITLEAFTSVKCGFINGMWYCGMWQLLNTLLPSKTSSRALLQKLHSIVDPESTKINQEPSTTLPHKFVGSKTHSFYQINFFIMFPEVSVFSFYIIKKFIL